VLAYCPEWFAAIKLPTGVKNIKRLAFVGSETAVFL
jgi:hypothetical protein